MKAAKFEYYVPRSLDEALDLLEKYEDDCKILAGGQSLIPVMNMRLSTPSHIIDINQIDQLSFINVDEINRVIRIGAMTRHASIENSEIIGQYCPFLKQAMKYIGHFQIRSRGTIGGSLVHADPSAELTLMLTILQGKVKIESSSGYRWVGPEDFFLTYLTTMIGSSEILTEVNIPIIDNDTGWSIQEFSPRHGDFALVAAATMFSLKEDGTIKNMCAALGGIGEIPYFAEEECLEAIGKLPSSSLFQEMASKIVNNTDPDPDIHASAAYRKSLAEELLLQSFQEAYNRILYKK